MCAVGAEYQRAENKVTHRVPPTAKRMGRLRMIQAPNAIPIIACVSLHTSWRDAVNTSQEKLSKLSTVKCAPSTPSANHRTPKIAGRAPGQPKDRYI